MIEINLDNMKKHLFLAAVICLNLSLQAQTKLVDYVNPLVGTDGYGNVYPGAQIPFGGIQISPDTDVHFYDAASGYKYSHDTILGFSLTHLSGTGIPDLGDFLFMPGVGELKKGSKYSHDREIATVDYYSVVLDDYGTRAEMTSGLRSGIFRFTFPKSDEAFINIDLDHTLWQVCDWANVRKETTTPSRATSLWMAGDLNAMCISPPLSLARLTI